MYLPEAGHGKPPSRSRSFGAGGGGGGGSGRAPQNASIAASVQLESPASLPVAFAAPTHSAQWNGPCAFDSTQSPPSTPHGPCVWLLQKACIVDSEQFAAWRTDAWVPEQVAQANSPWHRAPSQTARSVGRQRGGTGGGAGDRHAWL